MAAKRRIHPLIKVAIAIVLLAGVGLLFVRSVKDTRAEPYVVSASHLQNWTLAIDTAADADGAVVSLRPQPELPMNSVPAVVQPSDGIIGHAEPARDCVGLAP